MVSALQTNAGDFIACIISAFVDFIKALYFELFLTAVYAIVYYTVYILILHFDCSACDRKSCAS